MTSSSDHAWRWMWCPAGPQPLHQGLDSEVFDQVDIPYSETFVREAIQNSLDARSDHGKPVRVSFNLHAEKATHQKPFLSQVVNFRNAANLHVPDDWERGIVKWLTVQDFNTSGLLGALSDREGDFWNYWLNWGVSNKDCKGKGGRGIGRATFLIASQMHCLIARTKRREDGEVASCGMAMLRMHEFEGVLRVPYAFLAEEAISTVYKLHDSKNFHSSLCNAFALNEYHGDDNSGLSLVVVYPHDDLETGNILAASIENFAPAILNGDLVVEADDELLDADSIYRVSNKGYVCQNFTSRGIKNDVQRFLNLTYLACRREPTLKIALDEPSRDCLKNHKDGEEASVLRNSLRAGTETVVEVELPLRRKMTMELVKVKILLAKTPEDEASIDRFYRDGMLLPKVSASNTAGIDTIALVDKGELNEYLNLCEGKAHLDLGESKEVREELRGAGFPDIDVKRVIKWLPTDIRYLATPDLSKPDSNLLAAYFSIPNGISKSMKGANSEKPTMPRLPRISGLLNVTTLADGFGLRTNKEYQDEPCDVLVRVAYADGSRNPTWSEHDFDLTEMEVSSENCTVDIQRSKIRIGNIVSETVVEVLGFDKNRELSVVYSLLG